MKRRAQRVDLQRLSTEKANVASAEFDCKSSLEIARIINAEDAKVAAAVARSLPQIAQVIDWIAAAVPADRLSDAVAAVALEYSASRAPAEDFTTFIRRQSPERLRHLVQGGAR